MKKPPKQHWLVRLFTGFGYLSVLLQWMFLILLYFSLASKYGWLEGFVSPQSSPAPVVPPLQPIAEPSDFGYIEFFIVLSVVICIGAVIVYAARQLPSTISRAGDAVTREPAEVLTPVFLHRSDKRITKQRRLQLTAKLVIVMRVSLILLPLLLLLPLYIFDYRPLESPVLWAVAGFGAAISLFWLTAEYMSAYLLRTQLERTAS